MWPYIYCDIYLETDRSSPSSCNVVIQLKSHNGGCLQNDVFPFTDEETFISLMFYYAERGTPRRGFSRSRLGAFVAAAMMVWRETQDRAVFDLLASFAYEEALISQSRLLK